ncbi:MAG: DUF1127 domain-containing protein [Pseudomonas sp.]|nr:DUF1127 domain-containing protein [Pseudomonas sp.]
MERTFKRLLPQPTQVDCPLWLQLYATLRGWSRNLHSRRHLARLDNHQLVDAGISQA